MGETHSIGGREIKEKVFTVDIPFRNKLGNDLLPDNLKGPGLVVDRIDVAAPFGFIDVSPKPPIRVDYMSSTVFRLRIRAPQVTYEGPLVVTFGSGASDSINLNIQKTTLRYAGNISELENSGMVINMQKGQIFKRSVQLYKILSYGSTLNEVAVNEPFEIVSTEPRLPLTVDKKDSYIIGIYIKAPQYNYAGSIDLAFK
jgi:hypothetical protein